MRPTPRRALTAVLEALLTLAPIACGDDDTTDTETGTNEGGTTGATTDDGTGGESSDDTTPEGDLPDAEDESENVTDDTTTADTSP